METSIPRRLHHCDDVDAVDLHAGLQQRYPHLVTRSRSRLFAASWALVAAATLAGCGPTGAPLSAPAQACPSITAAEFAAAVAGGAVRADARVSAAGTVDMTTGSGVVSCSTGPGPKVCRRGVDLVIRYSLADGSTAHVRVPARSEYRFNVQRQPTHCELLVGR